MREAKTDGEMRVHVKEMQGDKGVCTGFHIKVRTRDWLTLKVQADRLVEGRKLFPTAFHRFHGNSRSSCSPIPVPSVDASQASWAQASLSSLCVHLCAT